MKLKRWLLKRKYKRLYVEIMQYDMYNCGHRTQLFVDSNYYDLCKKFNETADKLSAIDPACPVFRFDLGG